MTTHIGIKNVQNVMTVTFYCVYFLYADIINLKTKKSVFSLLFDIYLYKKNPQFIQNNKLVTQKGF